MGSALRCGGCSRGIFWCWCICERERVVMVVNVGVSVYLLRCVCLISWVCTSTCSHEDECSCVHRCSR